MTCRYLEDEGKMYACERGNCQCAGDHWANNEHNFIPQRNPATGLLVGVCECGEVIDHMGEPI
jgi:hypothetical protein